jgi:hypothetical protein
MQMPNQAGNALATRLHGWPKHGRPLRRPWLIARAIPTARVPPPPLPPFIRAITSQHCVPTNKPPAPRMQPWQQIRRPPNPGNLSIHTRNQPSCQPTQGANIAPAHGSGQAQAALPSSRPFIHQTVHIQTPTTATSTPHATPQGGSSSAAIMLLHPPCPSSLSPGWRTPRGSRSGARRIPHQPVVRAVQLQDGGVAERAPLVGLQRRHARHLRRRWGRHCQPLHRPALARYGRVAGAAGWHWCGRAWAARRAPRQARQALPPPKGGLTRSGIQ